MAQNAVLKGCSRMLTWKKKEAGFQVLNLNAPYARGLSEGLQRKLRRLGIGFVPKREEIIYINLCKLKQKMNFVDQKDVVYSVPCKEYMY